MKIQRLKWLTTGTAIAALLSSSAFAQVGNDYQEDQAWYNPSGWFDDEYQSGSNRSDPNEVRWNQNAYEQNRSGRNDRTVSENNTNWSNRNHDNESQISWKESRMERSNQNERNFSRSEQNTSNRNNSRSYGMSQSEEVSNVRGEVESFRSVRLPGASEERTLARLRLESGRSVIVDLGENTTVGELDLSQGDQVRIAGDVKMVEGRRIIEANRIRVDGDKVGLSSMPQN